MMARNGHHRSKTDSIELREGDRVRKFIFSRNQDCRNGIDLPVLSSNGSDGGMQYHGIFDLNKSDDKFNLCVSMTESASIPLTLMESKE
jgi:hypothetical protein